MEAFQHHVVFIFNLQSLVTTTLWMFWSTTTSSASWCFSNSIITIFIFWSYDQHQHLQCFDLSINTNFNNIFSTLTFRSATSSAIWTFNQQNHLQHFNLSINNIIFNTLTFRSTTYSSALSHFDQEQHHHHTLIFQSDSSLSLASDLSIRTIIII